MNFFSVLLEAIFNDTFLSIVSSGAAFLSAWAPVWLPIVFLTIFWRFWVYYVRAQNIAEMEWVFLEVQLPREITKSPLAMELTLNALQMGFGEDNLLVKYWGGGVRPWTSLELISIDGRIHFIWRIPKGSQKLIESQIYAQYPDVEIFEVPDYTLGIDFEKQPIKMWGTEFVLTDPDPYPIKTYVDYGLDKDPKEELKVDPITPAIEWLGSLGKGEQAWIQILARQHKKEDKASGLWGYLGLSKTDKWKDDAKKEIEKVIKDAIVKPGEDDKASLQNLTEAETLKIKAIERSLDKNAFDVGIRGIYLAEEDTFSPANIGGLIGSFRQYNSAHLNGFKPKNTTGVKYPWQDFGGRRVARKKREILDAYKRRSYFHPPYKRKHFILTTEELATIYHFPGRVLTTPTVKRLESRKAEPPTDLPM